MAMLLYLYYFAIKKLFLMVGVSVLKKYLHTVGSNKKSLFKTVFKDIIQDSEGGPRRKIPRRKFGRNDYSYSVWGMMLRDGNIKDPSTPAGMCISFNIASFLTASL